MQNKIAETEILNKREGGILIPFSILTDTILTNTEKHVYSYILAFNVNGLDYFSGSEATGEKLGLNPVQVRRAVARLCNLGYLTRAKSKGMSVLRCNKLIQLSDPIVTNRIAESNESLHETKQIVTHNNIYNNTSNNNYNNTTEDRIDPTLSRSEIPVTSDTPSVAKQVKSPSPKVAAKGVPCPDHEDESLKVRMEMHEWEKFRDHVGLECAMWWCAQLEEYAATNPKKFQAYKSHWRTLQKWHQMRCAENLVFGWTQQGGYGFYKPWVNGLKVGGKNG